MKKAVISAICAVAMILAIPGMAFAADSPSTVTVGPVTSGKVTLQIQYTGQEGDITIAPTNQKASNTPDGTTPDGSFDVQGTAPAGGLLMTFGVGSENAGAKVDVYVQHEDGTNEVKSGTANANGAYSVNMDKLSIYSVVVTPAADNSSKSTDTSSKSPKTGTDAAPAALALGALCLGGAAIAFARSRKEN